MRQCVPGLVCEAAPWDVPGWSQLPPHEQHSIRSVIGKSRRPMTMTVQTVGNGYEFNVNSWFSYTLIECGVISLATLGQIAAAHNLNNYDYDLVATLLRFREAGVQTVDIRAVHKVAIATSVDPASFKGLAACINAIAKRLNWDRHQIQIRPLDEGAKKRLEATSGFRLVEESNVFHFIPTDPAYFL